jgi:hypothetical protein
LLFELRTIPRESDSRSNDGMGQDIDMEIDYVYELQNIATQASIAECLACRYMRSSLVFRLLYSGTSTSLFSSEVVACYSMRTCTNSHRSIARCKVSFQQDCEPKSTFNARHQMDTMPRLAASWSEEFTADRSWFSGENDKTHPAMGQHGSHIYGRRVIRYWYRR